MDKTAQPPPYSETRPGFTPASYYQGPPPQQLNPSHPPLYPPTLQPQPYQSSSGQPTIIVQTTAAPTMVVLGNGPTHMICPSCRADIVTTVQHAPNFRTHCWAALLCLILSGSVGQIDKQRSKFAKYCPFSCLIARDGQHPLVYLRPINETTFYSDINLNDV